MWLGMLAAAAGQVPGFPGRAFVNALTAPLLAYIAQVAACVRERPGWACLSVQIGFGGLVEPSYAAMIAAAAESPLRTRLIRRRRRIAELRRPKRPPAADEKRSPRALFVPSAGDGRWPRAGVLVSLVALVWATAGNGAGAGGGAPAGGLRVSILGCRSGRRDPAPTAGCGTGVGGWRAARRRPGLDAAARPGRVGFGAAIVTHDQSDHAGGIAELFGSLDRRADRLLYAVLDRRMLGRRPRPAAPRHGPALGWQREVRSGALRLDVIWPPSRATSRRPSRRPGSEPVGVGHRRPLARLLDAAHRRCRGRKRPRSTPARSTSSRSPITAAPTPAWALSSIAPIRGSR